ncbi:MAG: acyl-CoA dehydrogenase family protein [Pseudomonadota bacterium]
MLRLSEEQRMLAESAEGVLTRAASIEHLRAFRDGGDPLGYSRETLRELGQMGFMGVLLPEQAGGSDMGARAAGVIAERMGRQLSPTPFQSTAVQSATALAAAGGEPLAEWGPRIASGEAVLALAVDERAKHDPNRISTFAEPEGNGFIIRGSKRAIPDAYGADHLIVAAQVDDQMALFLVDPSAEGVSIERRMQLDSRNAADLQLNGVRVERALGSVEAGAEILAAALRTGRAVSAAEQLGVAREVSERTIAYLTERRQFGAPLGAFQALQHRAADLYCKIEESASLVAAALDAIDQGSDAAERLSRAAKAKLAATARQATEEGVQMHGGVGMTDQYDLGLFMKRDRALSEQLGDQSHHVEWLLRERGL